MYARWTHPDHAGEFDIVRKPRQLLSRLVDSDRFVDVVQCLLCRMQRALERCVVRMIGVGVSEDLARGKKSACCAPSAALIADNTNMADQERVSSDALHRLEQKMFQLEVLDAEALQALSHISELLFGPLYGHAQETTPTSSRVLSDRSEVLRSLSVRAAFAWFRQ